MKVHFTYEDLPNSFNEFLNKQGEFWNLIPGVGFVEVEITTIKELYDLIDKFNKEIGSPVEVAINILEKYGKDDLGEEMMIAVVKPITNLFG